MDEIPAPSSKLNRRNGCMIATIGIIAACLIALASFWFVILPRAQKATANQIRDGIAAYTTDAVVGIDPSGGTLVIDQDSLTTKLTETVSGRTEDSVQGASIAFSPAGFDLTMSVDDLEIGYAGEIVAEDGEIQITNVTSSGDGASIFVPAETLGNAIEDGFNDAIETAGFEVSQATTSDGQLTLTLVPESD